MLAAEELPDGGNREGAMADPIQTEHEARSSETPPVVVKKYANRRLYNTESSSYITLDNLADMVRQGRNFVVYDAKSGEDITRGVLTQIIVEEEGKGHNLLPTNFLRQLIGFYGGSMQKFVPRYLEDALTSFAQQQEQMRTAMQKTMGSLFPFGNMEEVSRQNMAMMERAFSLFTPFRRGEGAGQPPDSLAELEALRMENESLRQEVAALRVAAVAPEPQPVAAQPAVVARPAMAAVKPGKS
jgi:polyhydroxyalkanoate synthesis repressor PhaR